MVRAAEDLARIEKKDVRTPEELKKVKTLENLKYLGISDEEKLELLLALAIPEEDRDIYRQRYELNSKLIKESPRTEQGIDEQVAENPTDFKKTRINKYHLSDYRGVTYEQRLGDVNDVTKETSKGVRTEGELEQDNKKNLEVR